MKKKTISFDKKSKIGGLIRNLHKAMVVHILCFLSYPWPQCRSQTLSVDYPDRLLRIEHQRPACNNVSLRNEKSKKKFKTIIIV